MSSIKRGWYNFFLIYIAPDLAIKMKRALLEKGTVVVLFILVLVVFSFADRDTKKMVDLYNRKSVQEAVDTGKNQMAEAVQIPLKAARN